MDNFVQQQFDDVAFAAVFGVRPVNRDSRQDQLPLQGADVQNAAFPGQVGQGVGLDVHRAHFNQRQHMHFVPHACGQPNATAGWNNPLTQWRNHTHHAADGVEQLRDFVLMANGG